MSFLRSREKGDRGCDKWSFSKSSTSPELPGQTLVGNARPWRLFLGVGDGADGGCRMAAGPPLPVTAARASGKLSCGVSVDLGLSSSLSGSKIHLRAPSLSHSPTQT